MSLRIGDGAAAQLLSGWKPVQWLLSQFAKYRKTAIKRYQQFILEGKGLSSPLNDVRHQLLLGDDSFVDQYNEEKKPEELREISRAHRRSLTHPLSEYQKLYGERNEAMARAYLSRAYTMVEIGEHFGVHYMAVSRLSWTQMRKSARQFLSCEARIATQIS